MCHGPKYLNLLRMISFHGNISPFNCPYSFLPPHALFLKQPKGKILKRMSSQKNTASFSSFCNDVAMNLIWPILVTRPKEVCMNKFSPVIFQIWLLMFLILTICICHFLDYEGELSDLATDSCSTFCLVSTKHNVFGSQSNRQSGNCIKLSAF